MPARVLAFVFFHLFFLLFCLAAYALPPGMSEQHDGVNVNYEESDSIISGQKNLKVTVSNTDVVGHFYVLYLVAQQAATTGTIYTVSTFISQVTGTFPRFGVGFHLYDSGGVYTSESDTDYVTIQHATGSFGLAAASDNLTHLTHSYTALAGVSFITPRISIHTIPPGQTFTFTVVAKSAVTATASGASPVVAATNSSVNDSATTSHTVNLPASIASGNVLLVLFSWDAAGGGVNTPSGWSLEASDTETASGSTMGLAVFSKTAAGTEGATLTVTTVASTKSTHQSYRLTGSATGSVEATIVSGTGNGNGNPPSITPSWGSDFITVITAASSQPVSASPVQTGSVLNFTPGTANSGTVSSTITVPADAEIVVVGVSGWSTPTGPFSGGGMTFTKGGVDTAMTGATAASDASNGAFYGDIFYLVLPDTGTNKTLKWDWASTSALDDAPIISVTFWKNVDTASPVRDSDGAQKTPPMNGIATPSLTAQTGDKIIAFATGYSGGVEGSVSAWSNLTELTELTFTGGGTDAAWATGDPTGSTTVGVTTTTWSDGSLTAIVLKPSSAGGLVSLPSGYTSALSNQNSYDALHSGRQSMQVSTTDPGAFTINGGNMWVAATVAVRD